MTDLRTTHPWWLVASWGAFLACSWTWCIGMFLPVLLIRDFGPWSFVSFAVPNVMGAASMGFVLAKPGASERLVSRHGQACWAFSLVTLAFQYFFLFWLVLGVTRTAWWLVAPGLLVLVLTTGARGRAGGTRLVAVGVLACSLLAACVWLLGKPDLEPSTRVPDVRGVDLVWLTPVMVLGFGLCPYLDLTFHKARQKLPGRSGSAAFAIGFGVMFLSMIVLTLLYAHPLIGAAQARGEAVHPGLAPIPILIHIIIQLAFTIGLHREWLGAGPSPAGRPVLANAGFLALVAGGFLALLSARIQGHSGLSAPELVYRLFMSFYGLIFPAYVWVCVIPYRNPPAPRRLHLVCALSIATAAPMFWMGFIERQTWWLGPGVLVVLLARLAARFTAGEPGRASALAESA